MNDYTEVLKSHKLSVTKQRCLLLRVLDEASGPMTIDDIVGHQDIVMNTSTIYRSLKQLVDVGVVYQTDFRDGAAYFEFHNGEHHHHITCTECKSRVALSWCMEDRFREFEKQTRYTITNHIFEIFGLCKNCS